MPNDSAVLSPEFAQSSRFRSSTELGSVFVSFNMLDPQLGASAVLATDAKHRALRCAISAAYRWDERIEKVYGGAASSFTGVIPPNVNGFERKNLAPSFALNAAKTALAAAGYSATTLPTLRFGSTAGNDQRSTFELFRAQMLDLGFPESNVQWQSFPSYGAYIEAVNRGEVMLMDMGWQLDFPDPENVLQLYYGPYKAPQVNNANYQNTGYDANFERIQRLPAGPERTTIVQSMNQQLIDDCVAISGATRRPKTLWRKNWRVWPDSDSMVARSLRFVAPAKASE
jgi:oligopeptide transport system substrate-binding protein